jgi:CDP-diacylglycerol--serine O-phosphatidyltransferase
MPPRPARKGIYILPNAITLAALFSGFYAIVMAMNGRFEAACIGIFCAAVLDSLDGRVARMTNSQSAFGEQMDSLCDMVSFGAAPALIVYEWALKGPGQAGLDPGLRLHRRRGAAAGALQHQHRRRRQALLPGPAQPGGGGLVMGLIWVMDDAGFKGASKIDWLAWTAFGVTLYAGLTMVTNVPFYSFKVVGAQAHRALRRDRGHRAGHRADQPGPAAGAVRLFCVYGCRATRSTAGASSRASR